MKCGYGLNWYIYANNNPLRFVDPTGLTHEESYWEAYQEMNKVTYEWPATEGRITSAFGPRESDVLPNPHPGLDIAPVTPGEEGQVFFASERGRVTEVGISPGDSTQVFIVTPDENITVYKHPGKIYVDEGDYVEQGQAIGTIDDHLHFEIRPPDSTVQAQAVDPVPILEEIPENITLTDSVQVQGDTIVNTVTTE